MVDQDGEPLQSLTCAPTVYKVSSVLNRNVREFGASNMFDGDDVKCWNSGQGSPQWIHLYFKRAVPVCVKRIQLMFQGGFAGQEVQVSALVGEGAELTSVDTLHPVDSNDLQMSLRSRALAYHLACHLACLVTATCDVLFQSPVLRLCASCVSCVVHSFAVEVPSALEVRLTFPSSTDFYGRITIYRLELLGTLAAAAPPADASQHSGPAVNNGEERSKVT